MSVAAAGTSTSPLKLRALELRGGNDAVNRSMTMAGFDAFLFSRPHNDDGVGGDLSFISTCAMENIIRFTLVDLAGHGESSGELATRFRTLFKKYINTPNPTKLAVALNKEFGRLGDAGRFATAVITTYFAPTDHLIICNAGHPRPLLFHAPGEGRPGRWELLDQSSPCVVAPEDAKRTGISNLPLGVIRHTEYPQFATRLERGDVVISYTDALIEATDGAGKQLGEEGLLKLVRSIEVAGRTPEQIGRALLDAVERHRGKPHADDDTTLLVLRHTATNPPDGAWPRLLALGRVVGIVK
jgi:phosphoserine phosphatase RsbU/P